MNSYHVKILQVLAKGPLNMTKLRQGLLQHGIDIGPDYAAFLLAELVNEKKIVRSQARSGWMYSVEVVHAPA